MTKEQGKEKQKHRAAARAKGLVQKPLPKISILKAAGPDSAETEQDKMSDHQKAELARWNASIWAGITGQGKLIIIRKAPADVLDPEFFTALGMAAFSSMEARSVGSSNVKEGSGMRPQAMKSARRILGNLEENIEAMRTQHPDICEYVLEVLNVDK